MRRLDPGRDSFEELTALLHRAYARHAARGLRFSATHQSAEVTRQRAGQGECWVGERDGRVVATITVIPPGTRDGPGLYARADVAKFVQMAVDPALQGQGLGRALLEHAEARARALGAAVLACDTSVHATDLHRIYARHGLRHAGFCDWRPYVNYLSVQLCKELDGPTAGPPPRGWDRDPEDAWNDRADRIRAVFGEVWPALPDRLALAERLGYPWREVSTAFLVVDVAHVGVLEVAAVLGGRSVAVAGVHAVGTVPAARGTGAGRRAMERALRSVDERFGTAWLTTEIPSYFERFGFRAVPEHRFRVRAPLPVGTAPPLRGLSADDPDDVAFVKRALARRRADSNQLAVEEEGWLFVIDELIAHGGFGTLHAADDALVAWQRNGRRAEILASSAPLREVAARLPADVDGIDLLFCPDLAGVPTDPVPGSPDGTVLMVRGDWPLEGPLVLPLHARC